MAKQIETRLEQLSNRSNKLSSSMKKNSTMHMPQGSIASMQATQQPFIIPEEEDTNAAVVEDSSHVN